MIKDKLFDAAKSIGINKIGVTKDGDSTVIAALFPYFVANEQGNIALYARSRDYHKINTEKLKILCGFLKSHGANECKIFVDNAARDDRDVARRAGLGFFGRNNLLINNEFGSYFTIGQIVTDLNIEPDLPNTQKCQNCEKCENACPTGALDCGKFHKSLCISEINQKIGELNESESKILKRSKMVWGCDICQMSCPHNENLPTTALPEFMENRIVNLTLQDIENLSGDELRQHAFSWRGVDVLKRNLALILQ